MESIVLVIGALVNMVLGGFVVVMLWRWFIVPVFGIRAINLAEALGLSFIISLPNYHYVNDPRPLPEQLSRYILVAFLVLVIGWILSLFVKQKE